MKSLKAFSIFLVTVGSLLFASTAFAGGPEVFTAEKCNKCHSVASAGVPAAKKPMQRDLSAVGVKHDAAWLTKYIKGEVGKPDKKDPATEKMHKAKFKGSDSDLATLTAWLAAQKTPAPAPAEPDEE